MKPFQHFHKGKTYTYCSDFTNDRKCHVDRPYFRYQFEFSNKVFEHELQELQGWFLFAMKFVQRTLFS